MIGIPIQLDFCKEFGYPPEIEQAIQKVSSLVVKVAQPASLMLLGSAARGELSYRVVRGRLYMFSDFEFCLVPSSVTFDEDDLRLRLGQLSRQLFPDNPFFHVDLVIKDKQRLTRAYPVIFNYEFKENGRTLFGDDLRHLIPQITVADLDLGHVRELMLFRLWALLLNLPATFLRPEATPTQLEELSLQYLSARNLLDIPTILLPDEGVLLPTYRLRDEYLQSHWGSLRASAYFKPDFPTLLYEALEGKLHLYFRQEGISLYRQTLQPYLALARYHLGLSPNLDATGLVQILCQPGPAPFAPKNVRLRGKERGYRALVALEHRNEIGWHGSVKWLVQPHHRLMLAFLISLHLGMLSYLSHNEAGSSFWLPKAEAIMSKLHLRRYQHPANDSSAAVIKCLRKEYAYFLSQFYVFNRGKYDQFCQAMEWQDAA